jgi:hypothetical protein
MSPTLLPLPPNSAKPFARIDIANCDYLCALYLKLFSGTAPLPMADTVSVSSAFSPGYIPGIPFESVASTSVSLDAAPHRLDYADESNEDAPSGFASLRFIYLYIVPLLSRSMNMSRWPLDYRPGVFFSPFLLSLCLDVGTTLDALETKIPTYLRSSIF